MLIALHLSAAFGSCLFYDCLMAFMLNICSTDAEIEVND